MTHAVFSQDGSSFVLADVFGVTRFALGKATKVKHTTKVSSAQGLLSVDGVGATAYVQGRVHTSAYGHEGAAVLALPGMGLRTRLARGASATVLVSPGGVDRLASMRGGALQLDVVEGESLRMERSVDLASLAARTLTPVDAGSGAEPEWSATLTALPDGRFVALGASSVFAGKLSSNAVSDEVWWRLPLSLGVGVEASLALDDTTAWLFLRDIETDRVRCVSVTREGVVSERTRISLATPAVSAGVLLTQPETGVVVATSMADETTQRYDVSAWNAHPAATPDASVYRGTTPRYASRLPGLLLLSGAQRWFVPWHREFAVDLTRGVTISRGLDAAVAPFRRLLLERFCATDELLRGLRVSTRLAVFECHSKEPRVSLTGWRSKHPPGLVGRVAEALCAGVHERYDLASHGVRWGSFGSEGGWATDADPATLDEVRAVLSWMRANDVVPADVSSAFAEGYDRGLGIPNEPYAKAFLTEGPGERLMLRALLETLAHDGWPEGPIPDAWATEALTVEQVRRVNAARKGRARFFARETPKMLAKMLARHMGADAMPLLLDLLTSAAREGAIYDEVRAIGEAITFVVHTHPERQADALAVIDDAIASGVYAARNTRDDLELTRERVGRRARHFWSNA